jgi:hypothetical protein
VKVVANGSLADNSYNQYEALAKIIWKPSAQSEFQGRGGWVERVHASFIERDFSGFNARASYHWHPTDRLNLIFNGWRETAAGQSLTASFSLNTGGSFIPSWNITTKVKLEGDFSYELREFTRFAAFTDPLLLIGRQMTFRNATARLIYIPYTGLELNASIFHSDMKSDSSSGGFNANGAIIGLKYTYGQR